MKFEGFCTFRNSIWYISIVRGRWISKVADATVEGLMVTIIDQMKFFQQFVLLIMISTISRSCLMRCRCLGREVQQSDHVRILGPAPRQSPQSPLSTMLMTLMSVEGLVFPILTSFDTTPLMSIHIFTLFHAALLVLRTCCLSLIDIFPRSFQCFNQVQGSPGSCSTQFSVINFISFCISEVFNWIMEAASLSSLEGWKARAILTWNHLYMSSSTIWHDFPCLVRSNKRS